MYVFTAALSHIAVAIASCASILAIALFVFLTWVSTMGAFRAPEAVAAPVIQSGADYASLEDNAFWADCAEALSPAPAPGSDGFTC